MDTASLHLCALLDAYTAVETRITEIIQRVSMQFCPHCTCVCCREEICRESVDSPFLSALVARQGIGYDTSKGWLGASGCRLRYGRPPVCHEYFCKSILDHPTSNLSRIRALVREFISLGNRTRGNVHLVCVQDLETISEAKLKKITDLMKAFSDRLDSQENMAAAEQRAFPRQSTR